MFSTNTATVFILFGTIIFLLYKYLTKNFDYWKTRNITFIKPTIPFGNFKDVVTSKASIGQFLKNMYESSKADMVGIWIFGIPNLVIRSPELIKNILVKDFNYFNDRTVHSDIKADPISANLLLTIKNPEWKIVRQNTSPIFTISKLKNMFPLLVQCVDDMMIYMNKGGQELNSKEHYSKFMTNVVTSVGFGVDAFCFEQEDAEFRVLGRQILGTGFINNLRAVCYFLVPSFVSFFKISFFDPRGNDFMRKAIWDTIAAREKSGIRRNDLIDNLIHMRKHTDFGEGIKFEGDMVVAQAVAFFAAGSETSSTTISFTLYELSLNQKIQTTLREELKLVHEKYESFTYDALMETPYFDKVLSETLRKYPSLPFLDRRCVQDYKVPDSDIVIEKGTPIFIPMMGLHYDSEYFPDPTVYDPERFSEENINARPKYSYMPFGHGPHNCIGEKFGLLTTKLCIAQILWEYRVEACDRTPVPLIFTPTSFVLQSKTDVYLRYVKL